MNRTEKMKSFFILVLTFIISVGIIIPFIDAVYSVSLADPQDGFIVSAPPPNSNVKGNISIQFQAYDDDQSRIEYSARLYDAATCSNQSFGNITSANTVSSSKTTTHSIAWNTTRTNSISNLNDGQYCLRLCLSLENNGMPYSACNARNINIINRNQKPEFTTFPTKLEYFEGETFTYDANAVDPDGDSVFYKFNQTTNFLSIDPTSGLVTSTPLSTLGYSEIKYNITIAATDKISGESAQTFTLIIKQRPAPTVPKAPTEPTPPPIVEPPAPAPEPDDTEDQEPAAIPIDITLEYPTTQSIITSDNLVLSWNASSLNDLERINVEYSTDKVSWQPLFNDIDGDRTYTIWKLGEMEDGDYFIRFTAIDSEGNETRTVSESFSIERQAEASTESDEGTEDSTDEEDESNGDDSNETGSTEDETGDDTDQPTDGDSVDEDGQQDDQTDDQDNTTDEEDQQSDETEEDSSDVIDDVDGDEQPDQQEPDGEEDTGDEDEQPEEPIDEEPDETEEPDEEPVEEEEPTLTFIFPGENTIIQEQEVLLEWETNEAFKSADRAILEYSLDQNTWFPITENLDLAREYHAWNISELQDNNYYIRVSVIEENGIETQFISPEFSVRLFVEEGEELVSAPLITEIKPAEESEISNEFKTAISGMFIPSLDSQIETQTFDIKLDGRDYKENCTINEGDFLCTTPERLSRGKHLVVATVNDSSGQEARYEWTFSVSEFGEAEDASDGTTFAILGQSIRVSALVSATLILLLLAVLIVVPWLMYSIWIKRQDEEDKELEKVYTTPNTDPDDTKIGQNIKLNTEDKPYVRQPIVEPDAKPIDTKTDQSKDKKDKNDFVEPEIIE